MKKNSKFTDKSEKFSEILLIRDGYLGLQKINFLMSACFRNNENMDTTSIF